MSDYEIEITVRGITTTTETHYGRRQDRPTLANLCVPISAETAWSIFGEAASRASAEDAGRVCVFPAQEAK